MYLPDLAVKIVNEVKKLIDENIIFVNPEGIILASTDPSRVGDFHQGAQIVAAQKEKRIISKEDTEKLIGVKEGINLPVFFRKDVIGVIGITGSPDKVSPFGEVVRKMTELLIRESYFSDQIELQSRSLETFVFDWIQGREWDNDFINRAQLLNINLEISRQAVLIELLQSEHFIHRDLYNVFSKWNIPGKNDVILLWGNHRILFLRDSHQNENREDIKKAVYTFQSFLKTQLNIPILIGVGQIVPSHDLHISLKQAERALKTTNPNNPLAYDLDLTLEIIIDEVKYETKKAFLERTITPLLNDAELLLTLRKWFENDLSQKNTALALHIHINTLHYRLKKIQELTHLNPNIIRDRITLYISIILLDEITKKKP